jgi:hypothetical protein
MPDTLLSPHFTLRELCRSEAAARKGFPNDPPPEAIAALKALCATVLEPLRGHVGKSIRVNSGYRGPQANAAVGGAPTSQHVRGEAADIEVDGLSNLALAQAVVALGLPFDQVILEAHTLGDPNSGWVHVSHTAHPRHQVLTATRGPNGKMVYSAGLPA